MAEVVTQCFKKISKSVQNLNLLLKKRNRQMSEKSGTNMKSKYLCVCFPNELLSPLRFIMRSSLDVGWELLTRMNETCYKAVKVATYTIYL